MSVKRNKFYHWLDQSGDEVPILEWRQWRPRCLERRDVRGNRKLKVINIHREFESFLESSISRGSCN